MKYLKKIKVNWYLLTILLFLFLGRLTLLGEGHLEDTDEGPYYLIIENFEHLKTWDLNYWNSMVFFAWSTYIETFIRFLQTFILHWYANINVQAYTLPDSLSVIAFFNVLTCLGIGFIFYKIQRLLNYSREISSISVIILGVFLNQNLYIRHILPYDSSYLFHLISIYILLAKPNNRIAIWIAGSFAAIGFFNYYGNFPLYIISYSLIFIKIFEDRKSWFEQSALFGAPILFFFLIFQYLSLKGGESYWNFLKIFSTTIFHGSPEESIVFIFKYFYEIEGVWGLCIMVLSIIGSFILIKEWKNNYNNKASILVFSSIAIYILYGLYAYTTGKFVFYGRVIHIFYPFIVIAVMEFLKNYVSLKIPLILGAVINFIYVLYSLNSLGYPRSMIYELGLCNNGSNEYIFNLEPAIVYNNQISLFERFGEDFPKIYLPECHVNNYQDDSLILKNFGFFYHYPNSFMETYNTEYIESGEKILVERLHFMSYPAYTYEYCTKEGREFLQKKQLMVSVVKK